MDEEKRRKEEGGEGVPGGAAAVLLRLARLRAGLELKEVCTGLCVPSYLSKIEHGKGQPDGRLLEQLFARLGIRYETDPAFLEACRAQTKDYFFRQRYGLDTSEPYRSLKSGADRLLYSPLAVDWLLILGFEGEAQTELLEKLEEHMTRRQTGYFSILRAEAEPAERVKYCDRAAALLGDTFSLRCLLDAWFVAGDYHAIHELENRFVAAALDEGNTFALGYYYHINATAYACVDMEEMMVSYYRKSEHLLMNTSWRDGFVFQACYNMGSVYVGLEQYEKALACFEKICADAERTERDAFFLWHKMAWACLGLGERDRAAACIERMGRLVREDMDEADVLMYEEIRRRADTASFLTPDYLELLERLARVLEETRPPGFLHSYRKILRSAYTQRRQYRKALETELRILHASRGGAV